METEEERKSSGFQFTPVRAPLPLVLTGAVSSQALAL